MRKALIAFSISVAAVVMLVAPAGAHAVLIDTQPAASEVYAKAPTAVVLKFDESVQVALGGVRLFDSQGHRIVTGAPTHPGGDGKTVSISVPALKDGTYVATWRVISADGHPVQNAFTFSVGSASPGAGSQGLANKLLSSQGGSRIVGVLNGTLRFIEFSASGLLIGAFAFVVLCWPAGRRSRVVQRMISGSWIVAFVGSLAAILIESSYTAGLGIADSFKPSIVHDYINTHVGHVMVLRVIALLAILVIGRPFLKRASLGAVRIAIASVLGLWLLATFSFAGHARTGFQVAGAVAADLGHLSAFSLWFGGLVVLVVAVLRPDDPSELEPAVTNFSKVALFAVTVLVGTGTYQGWRQVGTFGALKDTTYGRLLLVKVALVAIVVLAAALSRDVVRARLGVDELPPDEPDHHEVRQPLPVGPGAALADLDREDRSYIARRLRTSVGIEVAFLVAVLAVTSLLVNAAPARTIANLPFSATVPAKELSFEVLLSPARTGPNEFHLTVLEKNGVLANVLSAEADFSNPAKGIAPIKATLIRLGPGHYTSNNLVLPFAGKWTLEMKALVTEIDEVAVTITVPVRS